MEPVKLKKPRPNVAYQPLPAYNGFGSEEDSLGIIYSHNFQALYTLFSQNLHERMFRKCSRYNKYMTS